VLTANLLKLGEDLEALDEAGVVLVHVDVMDGVFCPQTTMGLPLGVAPAKNAQAMLQLAKRSRLEATRARA
jgi:pentose-5-phosphate-3-epimerase